MQSNIEQAFNKFLESKPAAWEKFCEIADNLWNAGVTHYGSKGIIETMRYHSAIDARPEHKWKLDNNWTPLFARKYLAERKDREGFFSTKPLKEAA